MARTITPFSLGSSPGDLDLRPQYVPKDIAAAENAPAAATPRLAPVPEPDAPVVLTALNLGGTGRRTPAKKSAT